MLSERLSDPRLLERAPRLAVPVFVDTDVRADVAKRLVVEDLPSVVIFDPDLGVIGRHENDYRNDADALVAMLDALPARRAEAESEWAAARAAVEARPSDGRAAVALGNVAFRRLRLDRADEEYSRALPLLAGGEDEDLRDDVEIARIHVRVIRCEMEDAIALADRFLARAKDGPFRARALYYRGYALVDLRRLGEARESLAAAAADARAGAQWRSAARSLLESLGAEASPERGQRER